MSSMHEGPDLEERETRHREANPQMYTEPDGNWPPPPRTVLLFCIAVMAFAVPWTWWALT